MKSTYRWSLMALVMLGAFMVSPFMVSGCASTQRGKYAQLNDSFIATTEILLEAKNTGVITPEEWKNNVVPALQLASALLDQYDEATKAGDESARKTAFQRFGDVMRVLRPFVLRAMEDKQG